MSKISTDVDLNGALDLSHESVVDAMNGKKVSDYEGRKAEMFFKTNPNARELGLMLLKELTPSQAQGLFTSYCRYPEENRGKILQGKKREAAGHGELALAQ